MSLYKFNESYHKLRTLLHPIKNLFTHHNRGNKTSRQIINATDIRHNYNAASILNSKAKSKIVLMELTPIVQELDVVLRVPFEMYYVGHNCQDIAQILNLPLGSVKNSIYSAQKELKEKIERRYMVA